MSVEVSADCEPRPPPGRRLVEEVAWACRILAMHRLRGSHARPRQRARLGRSHDLHQAQGRRAGRGRSGGRASPSRSTSGTGTCARACTSRRSCTSRSTRRGRTSERGPRPPAVLDRARRHRCGASSYSDPRQPAVRRRDTGHTTARRADRQRRSKGRRGPGAGRRPGGAAAQPRRAGGRARHRLGRAGQRLLERAVQLQRSRTTLGPLHPIPQRLLEGIRRGSTRTNSPASTGTRGAGPAPERQGARDARGG